MADHALAKPLEQPSTTPSGLHFDQATEYRIGPNPAIDMAAVIPDLESAVLNRFDEMQVFGPANFAQHDITGTKVGGIHRLDGALLPGFDPRGHRITSRPK